MGNDDMDKVDTALDATCINTIRFLAADGVEKANSGHPGMPMGDALMAYVLWDRFLRHNPNDPEWEGRDRFVLSAGHGSMLLYSLLHLTGYDLTLDDLKSFRQWGSKTPGHPEYDLSIGIEMTTGPLGQGFATGVGMAMAQRYLSDTFDKSGTRLFDYNIYAITSDGDIMEGVSSEAASLAGHLGLGSIVYLYSDNKITIEGSTDLSFTEDVAKKFDAFGWHVQDADGNDTESVARAIEAAKAETGRPSIIITRTNIGFGSPNKQDSASAHGSPLGGSEMELTRKALGWDEFPPFYIPEDASAHLRGALERGAELQKGWQERMESFASEQPELFAEFELMGAKSDAPGFLEEIPTFTPADGEIATRSASGKVLNAVAGKAPFLIGGSADLAPSNNTHLKGLSEFSRESAGRNIHFGVREHAMGSILNGMALSKRIIPYGGTFLIFSDYMKPAIRLAALMGLQVVYVFTHDSIGLGEDGPTHQPVEQLASLRALPNTTVIRPADAVETSFAWESAFKRGSGPTALALTRQKLPVIDRNAFPNSTSGDASKGGYVIADPVDGPPEIILVASGSEVDLAIKAYGELTEKGARVRVVSLPSFEIFEEQSVDYKEEVLPEDITKRIAIEAASSFGWDRYTGFDGEIIALDRFGASAPYKTNFKELGFSVERVVEKALAMLEVEEESIVNKMQG